MIVNCHEVGLDWETASLSAYVEAIAARSDKGDGVAEPTDGLKAFFKAHTLQ